MTFLFLQENKAETIITKNQDTSFNPMQSSGFDVCWLCARLKEKWANLTSEMRNNFYKEKYYWPRILTKFSIWLYSNVLFDMEIFNQLWNNLLSLFWIAQDFLKQIKITKFNFQCTLCEQNYQVSSFNTHRSELKIEPFIYFQILANNVAFSPIQNKISFLFFKSHRNLYRLKRS